MGSLSVMVVGSAVTVATGATRISKFSCQSAWNIGHLAAPPRIVQMVEREVAHDARKIGGVGIGWGLAGDQIG